jgi:uroporphyrinogen decarboxylase
MTRRERVLAAIRHQETDEVPYTVDFTQQALDRLLDYVRDPGYVDRIGTHVISARYRQATQIRPGYFQDRFGVVWNRTGADKDIGVVETYLIPEPSLANWKLPELEEAAWRAQIEHAIAEADGRYVMASVGFALFERAWSLRGMENLLVDMVAKPTFVNQLLDAICEFNLQLIDIALDYPIDGMHFGDDWGQQRGLIMGPNHWRRFIKPRLARMYERVKRAGRFVSQHSCGDNIELFGDLIELGLDVYQTFQPEIYDIAAVKREFGRDLAFWGGISTQRALPFLSPDQIKQLVRDTISIMRPGGGYIAAPTHALPADVPPQNIIAMVEALQSQ